jgi:hypothetical protein
MLGLRVTCKKRVCAKHPQHLPVALSAFSPDHPGKLRLVVTNHPGHVMWTQGHVCGRGIPGLGTEVKRERTCRKNSLYDVVLQKPHPKSGIGVVQYKQPNK